MQIDTPTAQAHGLSPHQNNFFNTFLGIYDVQGKDVLEVGGAMPSALVLDTLGANSWTCIQSAEYAHHRSDNQAPSNTHHDERYWPIYANVEDMGTDARFQERFDAIFSIACFEHVHKLPQALDVMHRALKPGGVLFSLFAPIWSGPWGQHYTDPVPERFDAIKPPEGWETRHIFGPWDHLLMSRLQFFEHYKAKFDAAYAQELTYITFNSPQINRYFFEDYKNFIAQTAFKTVLFKGIFPLPSAPATDSQIHALQQRYAAQGYSNFADSGVLVYLQK